MKLSFLPLLFIVSINALAESSCLVNPKEIGLVDQAMTLKEIEQKDLISGTCEKYKKFIDKSSGQLKEEYKNHPEALKNKVLCGKWIFFNLGMSSRSGIPVSLVKSMEKLDDAGPRLKKLGFLDDKSWANEPFPFGFVPSKHKNKLSIRRVAAGKNVQLSCVSCHSAQLSDGSYSVGASNDRFDFGKFNVIALYSIWRADAQKYNTNRWEPKLIEYYKSLEHQEHTTMLKSIKIMSYIPFNNEIVLKLLIGEQPPGLGSQRSLMNSKPGVFNGFAPVLNFHDKELYISTPQIWGIGKHEPVYYGNLSGAKNVEDFIGEAIVITTSLSKYNKKEILEPIAEYMKCLEAPKNPAPVRLESQMKGQKIFEQSCLSCHDLPDGASSKSYTYEEMGAPAHYKNLLQNYEPTDIQSGNTYRVFKKLGFDKSGTERLRARRLNGIWTRKNLTFNGSIDDMDHLFCLNGKSRKNTKLLDPQSDGSHSDLCENYSEDEKLNLVEYLKRF